MLINLLSKSGLVVIVSVSNSPHVKRGQLPKMLTLIDYNIETCGHLDLVSHPTSHILEIDLSDNLIMDWVEVNKILQYFPNLVFLNLARNLLSQPLDSTTLNANSLNKVDSLSWFMEIFSL